jgi:hypothetical protein
MEKPRDSAEAADIQHRLPGRSSHVHCCVYERVRRPTNAGTAGGTAATDSEAAHHWQAEAALTPLP